MSCHTTLKLPAFLIPKGKMLQPRFGLQHFSGVPGAIRTRGLSLRRRMLYPAELRRQAGFTEKKRALRLLSAFAFYSKRRLLSSAPLLMQAVSARVKSSTAQMANRANAFPKIDRSAVEPFQGSVLSLCAVSAKTGRSHKPEPPAPKQANAVFPKTSPIFFALAADTTSEREC